MKEIENIPSTEIVEKKKKQHEIQEKFQGSMIPHKNHTMFEYDRNTGEIVPAQFEKIDVELLDKNIRKKIKMKANCDYISALNVKNARKKVNKFEL